MRSCHFTILVLFDKQLKSETHTLESEREGNSCQTKNIENKCSPALMNEQHKLLTLKIKMTGYSPSDKFKTLTYSRNPTMKLLLAALVAGTTAAFTPSNVNNVHTSSVALSESMQDLENVAKKLNPVIGYYDPLKLAEANLWDTTQEETIGFIREAEIKHGRIAMFAFVGYIVHANGITWPWPMQLDGTPFPKVSSAPEAWDAISDGAKWQIIAFVGFLEYYREVTGTHYMKGGRAGDFPDFDSSVIPGGMF